ncbi:MAG TPA: hypothetical protein VFG54_04560 [Prolixibacteraceae bacterium]|nr:hypothetical protein [Prolixibacteraceae bacterium]
MDINRETKNSPVKQQLTSWRFWRPILSVLIGALAGYLYYHFIGCNSGLCAITSSPVMSTLWGGLMGFFLVNSPCSRGKC